MSDELDSPAQPQPADRSRLVWAVAAAVLVLIVGLVASRRDAGSQRTIRGTFTLLNSNLGSFSTCKGSGVYADFAPGQSLKVTNGDGKIVGTGTLRSVKTDQDRDDLYARESTEQADFSDAAAAKAGFEQLESEGRACPLLFDIKVADADFYEVHIGGGNRGSQTYSVGDLAKHGFVINLTLGR